MINSLKSVKNQLILCLAALAVVIAIKENDFTFLKSLAICVLVAVAIESFVLYLRTKSFKISESSIITGLIIGYVIWSGEVWWKLIFAVAVAILSKYLIVFKRKHIFNPAALGIFLSTLILGVSTQWQSTYMWYILVPLGLYFTYKIRKIEVIIGYIFGSLILFGGQALLQKVPLLGIFGYFSYFYIFVMVIEPKTTPDRVIAKYLFGAGTAILIFILTGIGVNFDVELFSLLIMNITVPFLNKISLNKGGVV